jgi:hypothetical protein
MTGRRAEGSDCGCARLVAEAARNRGSTEDGWMRVCLRDAAAPRLRREASRSLGAAEPGANAAAAWSRLGMTPWEGRRGEVSRVSRGVGPPRKMLRGREMREGFAPAGPRRRRACVEAGGVDARLGATVARRRWQQSYRCLRRAKPGPERSGGTRPPPAVAVSPRDGPTDPHPTERRSVDGLPRRCDTPNASVTDVRIRSRRHTPGGNCFPGIPPRLRASTPQRR